MVIKIVFFFVIVGEGDFGSLFVDFVCGKELIEIFNIYDWWFYVFKFDFIKNVMEVMCIVSKVSF